MATAHESDRILVTRVRRGEAEAWEEMIARFEGRLLAFVQKRLGSRDQAEDVVQETFIGFLTSLPHYDESRLLEGYLFSIAAHKLTDYLRREGRRPTVNVVVGNDSHSSWEPAGPTRPASSILRSGERRHLEEAALVAALSEHLNYLRQRGDWEKVLCAELLFVRGWANKEVATKLDLSEQKVANHKFEFLAKLRTAIRKHGVSDEGIHELSTSTEPPDTL